MISNAAAVQVSKKHKLAARGFKNTVAIVQEADRAGIALSLACSILMQESNGGDNVFGHDPTLSIPVRWRGTQVNRVKYLYYKLRRSRYGMQGVGPLQLTWYATQDAADKAGGCHKPEINMRIGFKQLADNIRLHGQRDGIKAYNGSGAAADAYATTVIHRMDTYHKLFAQD